MNPVISLSWSPLFIPSIIHWILIQFVLIVNLIYDHWTNFCNISTLLRKSEMFFVKSNMQSNVSSTFGWGIIKVSKLLLFQFNFFIHKVCNGKFRRLHCKFRTSVISNYFYSFNFSFFITSIRSFIYALTQPSLSSACLLSHNPPTWKHCVIIF